MAGLEPVLAAWSLAIELHELAEPASEAAIQATEDKIGRRLPAVLRALYEVSDGAGLLDGNLNYEELVGGGGFTGLERLTDDLAERGPELAPEIIVFGNDGSDALYGLWLPRGGSESRDIPVLELGMGGFETAIAATSLTRFLKGRTAYYLVLLDAQAEALTALGVPENLWSREPDDELFAELRMWADPSLDDPLPDPYERPVAFEQLRAAYGSD